MGEISLFHRSLSQWRCGSGGIYTRSRGHIHCSHK